jgi:hypothetical protein
MSKRARHYLVLAVTVALSAALGLLSRVGNWSDVEAYVATAGLIVVIGAVGLPWREFAPDGAFRRRSPPR